MPRSKQGVKRVKVEGNDVERAAVLVLENNWSIRQAAVECKVSKSTLSRHLKIHKAGNNEVFQYKAHCDINRVFTPEEEETLKNYLQQSSQIHYGLTRKQFRILANDFAQVNKKKVPESWIENGLAGKNWYYEFMNRHKDALSLRKPQATSLSRSTSFNRYNVSTFFAKLKGLMEREHFTPERVYNIDETGMSTVHNPNNVIAIKGMKQVGHMTSGERGINVTMIAGINAIGNSIPPAFVFPRVFFKEHMLKGAPPGSIGFAHPSGWSNSEIFLEFLKHFINHTRPTMDQKVLLILDNHKSHITVDVLNLAKKSGIVLLTFPPHTSHKLQPLDRGVFGPLKKYYNSACGDWLLKNCAKPMTIYDVCECVGIAYPLAFTPNNILAGFRVSGIYPFNENIFQDCDFLSSSVTDRPEPIADPSIPSSSTAESAAPTNFVSPEQIRPFPKAGSRQVRRGGPKPGRCRVLTDTPEKEEIENEEAAKKMKIRSKDRNKIKHNLFEKEKSSDSEEDGELSLSSDSLEDVEFGATESVNIEEEKDLEIENVQEGGYALVRVAGKKKEHFYVVEILKLYGDVLEVRYLKKAKSFSENKFVYSSEQTYELSMNDIIKLLPAPVPVGSTSRQTNFMLFTVDFTHYNVE